VVRTCPWLRQFGDIDDLGLRYNYLKVCKPMEVTVKPWLLLTSVLFLFVQIPTTQAQVTVDVSKITCEQLNLEKLAVTSRDRYVVA